MTPSLWSIEWFGFDAFKSIRDVVDFINDKIINGNGIDVDFKIIKSANGHYLIWRAK